MADNISVYILLLVEVTYKKQYTYDWFWKNTWLDKWKWLSLSSG